MAKQLGMLIDEKRCIACTTCVMACKIENNLPVDVLWNRAIHVGGTERDSPEGTYPDLKMSAYTLACQHCKSPACAAVCPTGAAYKREADGIVMQNADVCIGCKLCLEACPYEGVRTFLAGEPRYHLDFAVGGIGIPGHQENTVEKCTFCSHRIDRGEQPACIPVCPGRARFFGDINDPQSEVSQILSRRDFRQLQVESKTEPSVYLIK